MVTRVQLSRAGIALLVAGCWHTRVHTIDGPEAPQLRDEMTGIVIKNGSDIPDQERTGLFAIDLPDGDERLIRARPSLGSAFGSVAGPDAHCNVAYTEYSDFRHRNEVAIKLISIDGTGDRELLRRRGHNVGTVELALAQQGDRLAFIAHVKPRQVPGALLEEGLVELWDVAGGHGSVTNVIALAERMTWFPDGRSLVYTALVPRSQIAAPPDLLEKYAEWSALPVVHVLETGTGQRRPLVPGWRPVLASDGASALIDGLDGNRWQVDTVTGEARRKRWKGDTGSEQIALLSQDIVLVRAPTTTGASVALTKYGSFKAGTVMGSLKVARLDTELFHTVVPAIDWRDEVSFGRCERSRSPR